MPPTPQARGRVEQEAKESADLARELSLLPYVRQTLKSVNEQVQSLADAIERTEQLLDAKEATQRASASDLTELALGAEGNVDGDGRMTSRSQEDLQALESFLGNTALIWVNEDPKSPKKNAKKGWLGGRESFPGRTAPGRGSEEEAGEAGEGGEGGEGGEADGADGVDGADAATATIPTPAPDDEGDGEDGDVGLGLDAIVAGGAAHDAATGPVTDAPAATTTTDASDEGYSIDLLQLDQIQSTAHDSDHSDDDAEIL